MPSWQLNDIDAKLIDLALEEDLHIPFTDITSDALFKNTQKKQTAKIISKHSTDIVISGIPIIAALFKKIGADYKIQTNYKDGDILKPGKTLLTIQSDAKSILMIERTLLNFLRHLCAIATLTKKFVTLTKDTQTKILDTRKTTPAMRHLEKYAVHCGGGVNHRIGLYDAFMIKDTHVGLIGGMKKALDALPDKSNNPFPVIVEISSKDELNTAIKFGSNKINRVLLDNMSPELLQQCVDLCKDIFETEASGNINLQTIATIAKTGVDYASVGMLTYAAGHVDLAMII